MSGRRPPLAGAVAAILVLTAAIASAQAPGGDGHIGAALSTLNNGRHLQPFGRLSTLGNFPTGGAVTPDGRFYWTVSTGRGPNDIRIVSLASGQVVQTLAIPGASGGIAMDPRRSLVYVSGLADSSFPGDRAPAGTPGAGGDAIHVFRYDGAGHASFDHLLPLPPPPSASAPQNFPPTNTRKVAWPDRLAISPDGATLLVPLNLADAAAVVDTRTQAVRYVATGNYPYGAAILKNGRLGLVSNETPGTVSVIELATARKIAEIQVGPHLSHPEAIAVDPVTNRAYVAVANADEVAVIDTHTLTVERTLSVGRPEGIGTSPVALTTTPDGSELLVAEAGGDEIAVFRTADVPGPGGGPAFSLVGRIPTAQYPVDVQVVAPGPNPCGSGVSSALAPSPVRRRHVRHRHLPGRRGGRARAARVAASARRVLRSAHRRHHRHRGAPAGRCAKLVYLSAKGLGTGPNPQGPQPSSPLDTDSNINQTQYLPLLNIGSASVADYPSDARIAALDPVADRQVVPTNAQSPPPDTPLRPDGPIKHIFYIVKENRTYDQILGDDPRGDGAPGLALFGGSNTPNAHALVRRFPLVDHVYANSEASIDGHFWTSAGSVSDYVNKNWFQNYASRLRPYDFGVYAVTWPATGFLFDQAEKQGISYFNYGEAISGVIPFPDKDRTTQETLRVASKFTKSDVGTGGCYPNDASIGKDAVTGLPVFDSTLPLGAPVGSMSRTTCFQLRFAAQVATGSVPTFNYLVLSNDHTRVLDPTSYTPQAMIADNDYALGQMVQTISHSPIWGSSAIFVVEDDSQDGADHVDAHRIPAYVISPYAKQGAVVHTRYDFLSVIHSMELIMGMRPLGLFDSLGVPMYDAFDPAPVNAAPYDALVPPVDLLAKNPPAVSRADARARRFRGIDQISQRLMDRLLWRSVHGKASAPPPPGPGAVSEPRAGRAAGFDG